jgi:hypothetical protein
VLDSAGLVEARSAWSAEVRADPQAEAIEATEVKSVLGGFRARRATNRAAASERSASLAEWW